jgi:hypothetical protein
MKIKKLYLVLALFMMLASCENRTAHSHPRNDQERLHFTQQLRTLSPPSESGLKLSEGEINRLAEAGLGLPYYFSYHLQHAGNLDQALAVTLLHLTPTDPWREYAALRMVKLYQEGAVSNENFYARLDELRKRELAILPGINYAQASFAFSKGDMVAVFDLLNPIATVNTLASAVMRQRDAYLMVAQTALKMPNWQTQLDRFFMGRRADESTIFVFENLQQLPQHTSIPNWAIYERVYLMFRGTEGTKQFIQLSQAIEPTLFAQWAELIPTFPRVYANLASTMGQSDLAIRMIDNALKVASLSQQAQYTLHLAKGVIQRRINRLSEAEFSFALALNHAIGGEDRDEALWYWFDTVYRQDPERFFTNLIKAEFTFYKPAYFDDILARILADMVGQKRFNHILTTYEKLVNTQGSLPIRAEYAWVLIAAIKDARLPKVDNLDLFRSSLIQAASEDPFSYPAFMTAAWLNERPAAFDNIPLSSTFNLGGTRDNSAILSIDKFSIPFSEFAAHAANSDLISLDLYLLGFIYYNLPYDAIAQTVQRVAFVSGDALRLLARGLNSHGLYLEGIRMMMRARRNVAFKPDLMDFKVLYPRAFEEEIHQAATNIGMNVNIYYGLIRNESGFTTDVVSRAQAIGLTQLMPATAAEWSKRLKMTDVDLTNPAHNLYISSAYIRWMQGRLESMHNILAGYNGGPNRVRRWRETWQDLSDELFIEAIPYSETRNYVKDILVAAVAYGFFYDDEEPIVVISEIFPSFKR